MGRFFEMIADLVGWGWFILGILLGLATFGGMGGMTEMYGLSAIIGLVLLLGIWFIGYKRNN